MCARHFGSLCAASPFSPCQPIPVGSAALSPSVCLCECGTPGSHCWSQRSQHGRPALYVGNHTQQQVGSDATSSSGVCVPQVLELLLDRKAADARHAREVAARDAELTRLQDYIDSELSELQQRQAQVGG